MPGYWVTFRFSGNGARRGEAASIRREAFMDVFSELTSKVWAEPADFVVFDAPASIEIVASLLQETIDTERDMFMIHEINGEGCHHLWKLCRP